MLTQRINELISYKENLKKTIDDILYRYEKKSATYEEYSRVSVLGDKICSIDEELHQLMRV